MAHGDKRGVSDDATKAERPREMRTDCPSREFSTAASTPERETAVAGLNVGATLSYPLDPPQFIPRTEQGGSRLAIKRIDAANALRAAFKELRDEGHGRTYGKRTVADRDVGVDEKLVRKWCDFESDKAFPAAALALLPTPIVVRFLQRFLTREQLDALVTALASRGDR